MHAQTFFRRIQGKQKRFLDKKAARTCLFLLVIWFKELMLRCTCLFGIQISKTSDTDSKVSYRFYGKNYH